MRYVNEHIVALLAVRDDRPRGRRQRSCGWPSRSGRAANPDLHIGVCGEHGGDPESIDFFAEAGLDYVSCSPFRVPVARVAAAQAAAKH